MTGIAVEANFDGLVGPTHNYSGLSYGNVASVINQQAASNPRQAALQGLEKMKFMADLGIVQGVLPPHERPYTPALKRLGFEGSDKALITAAAESSLDLLYSCCSAAAMWTANAATVSPSADSSDGKVHMTPANLVSKFHRSLETSVTGRILQKIFSGTSFTHHSPLPPSAYFSDEGAANHTRLCVDYGGPGIQLFVWGRSSFQKSFSSPVRFPARQTLEASRSLARLHRLCEDQTVFAQQNPAAIDAGVFHNDVISVGNKNVFFHHEESFVDQEEVLRTLANRYRSVCSEELIFINVAKNRISLEEAVSTYLFNSQLISLADGKMALIAPLECKNNDHVQKFLNEMISSPQNPVKQVHFLNLRESMRNGGGPACLRLRVVLNEKELRSIHQRAILTDDLYGDLKGWIIKHYREELFPRDLADPFLLEETLRALDELTVILQLGPIYDFQK